MRNRYEGGGIKTMVEFKVEIEGTMDGLSSNNSDLHTAIQSVNTYLQNIKPSDMRSLLQLFRTCTVDDHLHILSNGVDPSVPVNKIYDFSNTSLKYGSFSGLVDGMEDDVKRKILYNILPYLIIHASDGHQTNLKLWLPKWTGAYFKAFHGLFNDVKRDIGELSYSLELQSGENVFIKFLLIEYNNTQSDD